MKELKKKAAEAARLLKKHRMEIIWTMLIIALIIKYSFIIVRFASFVERLSVMYAFLSGWAIVALVAALVYNWFVNNNEDLSAPKLLREAAICGAIMMVVIVMLQSDWVKGTKNADATTRTPASDIKSVSHTKP